MTGLGSYVPRFVDAALEEMLGEMSAVMINGPRGCGKTTTARQLAETEVHLDEPRQAAAFRAAPDAALAALTPPVLLDEWQEVPEVLAAVKRAVDSGGAPGRFVLTGSVRGRMTGHTWPATGRITSEGMGGKMFSRNMTSTRPGYPLALIRFWAHRMIGSSSWLNPIHVSL